MVGCDIADFQLSATTKYAACWFSSFDKRVTEWPMVSRKMYVAEIAGVW